MQAPQGVTRILVLPTGAGKSLCFQLLPRFFAGLTVVVVPTIALAMDQQANAAKWLRDLPGVNPVYFASDDAPEVTLTTVEEKRTRLLFTSPEACVSGRFRRLPADFAAKRWLTSLVVDEAHLIETWGAQFRVEFQLLAGARRRWREASEGTLRTFLFSATMTPRCRELLQKMFSDGGARRLSLFANECGRRFDIMLTFSWMIGSNGYRGSA
jgi:ATP-dependent DNA helicase RecQ